MAIIRLQQWEVKFRGGERRLLYADEEADLGLLDIELRRHGVHSPHEGHGPGQ